jgi:hypothetical protein
MYVSVDSMLGRKWKPKYVSRPFSTSTPDAKESEKEAKVMMDVEEPGKKSPAPEVNGIKKKKSKAKKQELSTKSEALPRCSTTLVL